MVQTESCIVEPTPSGVDAGAPSRDRRGRKIEWMPTAGRRKGVTFYAVTSCPGATTAVSVRRIWRALADRAGTTPSGAATSPASLSLFLMPRCRPGARDRDGGIRGGGRPESVPDRPGGVGCPFFPAGRDLDGISDGQSACLLHKRQCTRCCRGALFASPTASGRRCRASHRAGGFSLRSSGPRGGELGLGLNRQAHRRASGWGNRMDFHPVRVPRGGASPWGGWAFLRGERTCWTVAGGRGGDLSRGR